MVPSSSKILQSLETISNDQITLALIFHLLIFGLFIALLRGWRPFNRIFGSLLALPLFSVSAVSFWYDNPFNGVVFIVSFVLLVLLSIQATLTKIELTKGWILFPAVIMLLFGWSYPHFLNQEPYAYFIAAPMGLIPCPTLSVIIGFALLFNGLHSKRWSIALSLMGLAYGMLGVIKLDVRIDLFLIAGSLILFYQAIKLKEQKGIPEKSVNLTF